MNPIKSAAAKAREQAESLQREAATYERLASVKAFADLPSDFIHLSSDKSIWVRVPCADRMEAAARFEALAAIMSPLPIIAAKGTFASVKPACDYVAKDGEIMLDAESSLPAYLYIDGFGADRMANAEKLVAWFETETDRVKVEFEIKPALARCYLQHVKDNHGRTSHMQWEWRGLPHSNMSFAYASGGGSPNSFAYLFDVSLDLAAWLAGDTQRDVRK